MNFYHRGSNGDIIYSLPTIIAYGEQADLYLRKQEHLVLLCRLLKLQPYIKSLNKRRYRMFRSPCVNLSDFYEIAWEKRDQHLVVSHLESHGKTYDLTQAWLHNIEPNHVADIIINRTQKYHDRIGQLDWQLLKKFNTRCKFIGMDWEMKRFDRQKIDVEYYETKDALEMAQVIKGCKLFVGNQSLAFALAEAMKHPRCLEACQKFNNCQPHGKDGHTHITTELIEKYLGT